MSDRALAPDRVRQCYLVAMWETEEQMRQAGRTQPVLSHWQPYFAPSRVEVYRDLGERGEIRDSGQILLEPTHFGQANGLEPVTLHNVRDLA